MKHVMRLILGAALLLGSLTACQGKEKGVYVFATDATWPPMEFLNESQEIVGFSVDLLEAIAKEAGFKYELKNLAWEGLFTGLRLGNYDAVHASVTITDERKEEMDFSDPYWSATQVLVLANENEEIHELEDSVGKILGAQIGTAGAIAIERNLHATLKSYDAVAFALTDLIAGRIDGVVADSTVALQYAFRNKNFKGLLRTLEVPGTDNNLATAFNKGENRKLRDMFNEGLRKLRLSGEYQKLVDKWHD